MIDHYAVRNRHVIGVDNMMWSSDYPHHGCDWPETRRVVDDMFRDVAADERAKMCALNAASCTSSSDPGTRPACGFTVLTSCAVDAGGRLSGADRDPRAPWPTKMRFGSLITSGFARTMFWKADALP